MSMNPWPLILNAIVRFSPGSLHFSASSIAHATPYALSGAGREPSALNRVWRNGGGNPAEIGTASQARHEDIGVLAQDLELALRFEADHGLMEEDVAQYGAEAVDRLLVSTCVLEAL